MPKIQIADKPTLDWIKNKFYKKTIVGAQASNNVVATLLDTEEYGVGSSTSSPVIISDVFVAPIDGYYRVRANAKNGSHNYDVYIYVYKNGNKCSTLSTRSIEYITLTDDIELNKGDVIDVRMARGNSNYNAYCNSVTVCANYTISFVEKIIAEEKEYDISTGSVSSNNTFSVIGDGVIYINNYGNAMYNYPPSSMSIDGVVLDGYNKLAYITSDTTMRIPFTKSFCITTNASSIYYVLYLNQ